MISPSFESNHYMFESTLRLAQIELCWRRLTGLTLYATLEQVSAKTFNRRSTDWRLREESTARNVSSDEKYDSWLLCWTTHRRIIYIVHCPTEPLSSTQTTIAWHWTRTVVAIGVVGMTTKIGLIVLAYDVHFVLMIRVINNMPGSTARYYRAVQYRWDDKVKC